MKINKKISVFLILLLIFVVVIAFYTEGSNINSQKSSYSTIIAFGDSLTDNGNTYKKSLDVLPNDNTWYKGRFSNYKVWVEYLCQYSKDKNCKLLDYAYGGAYSLDGYQKVEINDKTIYKLITNYLQQVENFVGDKKQYYPDHTLYVMDIGSNDIMELKNKKLQIAKNINKAIEILISEKNAKHILVLNLPDFSKAPRYFNASNSKREEMHKKIIETNANIEKVVSKYKQQGIDIKVVDFYSLLNKLIENKKYISDKSCLDIPLKTDKLDYLLDYDQTPNCHENINKYIFFDNLHPTNSIHKKIAFLASRNF